ncbi:D-alanyl-D-alanine carboxypeptidase [Streptomyces sp. NPDC058867]|uniref:D-alanyl-D-alanine carboxypeptidase n=1 Tax=unclassified Streptomyces TaxID=2593676 RepID=UPI0036D1ADFA
MDTATRVLSARDLAEARKAAPDASGEPETDEPETDAPEADAPETDEPEADESAGDTDAAAESGTDVDAETDADAEPAAPKAGDERLRAAVAAWVAGGDESGAKDAEGAQDAPEAPGDGQGADAEAQDGPEDADATEAEGEAEGPAATGEAEEDDADTEDAADTRSDAGPEPEVDAESESDADAGTGDAAGTTPEPAPDAASDTDADTAPDTDAADSDAADTPTPATDAEADTATTTDATAPPAPRAKVVDQPTTAIRLRPSEDRKSPAPAPAASAPAAPAPSAPAPAAPAPAGPPPVDRATSKFVALKPDVTTAVPQVGPERTTQQPLPPKPPLDLLAELTNTPPPPETPVRTLVRRVKIWTPLVLLLVIVFAIAQAVRPVPTPTLDLTAESTYTFEGSKVDIPWPADGQAALDVQGIGSFGSSGDQKPVPIASVAKVMTAYVILRDHPLKSGAEGPKIQIDKTAEEQSDAGQESTVDVTAGDAITEREALESILIASANNVARLLARWDAGSEKAFVEKMNAAAEDLGMSDTTYTDPSGLNDTTVSTAVDQVKLAKAAMEQPVFREVAAMMSYDDYKGQNHGNWNQLVGSNNVVGIKTGTTTSALGNLVFAAKKEVDGEMRTIVGAVVRQPDSGSGILAAALNSGDQLIRAAQGALESATLLKKGEVVGYVDDGLGGRTAVVATKDVKAAGWAGLKVELDFTADTVPHEAKAGTEVGTLTVGDGGTAGAVKVPVALQSDLVEPGFLAKLTRIT